jgi:hypothetical protein
LTNGSQRFSSGGSSIANTAGSPPGSGADVVNSNGGYGLRMNIAKLVTRHW